MILCLQPLADLSEMQIKRGFALALKEYKPFGGSFPSPGEIREYALRDETHVGFPDDAPEVLARKGKPDDWVPIEQLKAELRKVDNANRFGGRR